MKCPKCGSNDIAGLIPSFWVPLCEDGMPEGQWRDWESNTQLSEQRQCSSCFYEWSADNE